MVGFRRVCSWWFSLPSMDLLADDGFGNLTCVEASWAQWDYYVRGDLWMPGQLYFQPDL